MAIKLSDHFTYGKLLRFTLPSISMMIFTSVYSVVDGLFVSNLIGENALSAVNIMFPVAMIVGAVGFMLGAGGSAIVARTMGEGKQELANRFATYLTTEYLDNFYTRTGKTASSYHAAYENFWLNAFRSEYEKSIPMPKMIETSNFWIQLEILFSRVWNGENINDLVRGLSEQMMTQILGQPFTEEYIEEPQTEPEEEEEYIDDGETMDDGEVTNQ